MTAPSMTEALESCSVVLWLRRFVPLVHATCPGLTYEQAAALVVDAGNAAIDRDLPVGTLCHEPQVPAALGLLQGRKSSGFPPLGPDIEAAGGTYVEGPDVVDGNMVSCRGWGDLAEWSKAFVSALERAAVPA